MGRAARFALVNDGDNDPEIRLAPYGLRNCLIAKLRIRRAQLARYCVNLCLPLRKDRASCPALGIQRRERHEIVIANSK
jgi:hypothetical protein